MELSPHHFESPHVIGTKSDTWKSECTRILEVWGVRCPETLLKRGGMGVQGNAGWRVTNLTQKRGSLVINSSMLTEFGNRCEQLETHTEVKPSQPKEHGGYWQLRGGHSPRDHSPSSTLRLASFWEMWKINVCSLSLSSRCFTMSVQWNAYTYLFYKP